MARRRTTIKGISHITLFILGAVCFVISRFFEGRIEALNYVFAVIGLALFVLCFVKYRNRKR